SGDITGAHRTWLDPTGEDKAPVDTPRRAMGHLLGHGVRFGVVTDVMVAGEGIETVLSVRSVLPNLPMVAALSANHLAALLLPAMLRRIYLVRDNDAAGDLRSRHWRNGRRQPASRRSRCRRRWGISMKTSAVWASIIFERPCACSLPRKMSLDS